MTRKAPTSSIRVRNTTYAWLQQQAADEGIKVVDLIEYIVEQYKKQPKEQPPKIYDPGGLPEFDVDGNRVGRWIRDH